MSGLSQNDLEGLSSERIYRERNPHLCNMLRFAVLEKDEYFMAIGGRWEPCDGGDPSVDDYSLVQTIIRCAKEIAHLDLKRCKNWNRFLEIHYDRVGKDGLFSHKEVTVLYIPDLSDCLPSLDSWRDQWLAHKKSIDERKRLQTPRKKEQEKKQTGKKADQTSSTSGAATEKQKISLHDYTAKSKEKGLLKDEKEREGWCGKAEPPQHPGFILQTTGSKDAKMHSLSLSLDSLLNYSNKDIQEPTFEISLFAESFYEMLQYEMGSRLLNFFEKFHVRFVNKRNGQKRSREVSPEKESEETSRKRVKIDDLEELPEEDEKMVECEGKDNDEQLKGSPETKQGTVEVGEAKIPKTIVNKELLQAFRFFDRNRVGYIRVGDMRLIIHSMGKSLSQMAVKEMVKSALLESNAGRDDRIFYEKLVTTLI